MRFSDPILLCAGTPEPGPEHNAGLPSLLRCPDASLLLAHRVGTHKNSQDGTQFLWRSRDEGRTWGRVPFPFAATPQGDVGEFRTAALSCVGPGRIAMLLTWIDHPDAIAPLSNAKTEGLLPIHIGWTASADSGATWSPLREIAVAPYAQPCGNGPLLRLPDGRWLVAFEIYKTYDDPAPWSSRSAIMFSSDEGASWTPPQILAEDPTHERNYWDHHPHLLADGTLVDLMWIDDRGAPGRSEIQQVRSSDGGRTWSRPAPTGLVGQYSSALTLADSTLLLFYVVRHGDSSIRLARSFDGGISWRTEEAWVLYSQAGRDLAKLAGKDFAAYIQSMGQWTFGWPSALQLPSGEILASYYAGEGDRSSIYLRRLRLA